MLEYVHKFTSYHNGEHALLVGHGQRLIPGQHISQRSKFYEVEEVYSDAANMWTASLKQMGKII